MGVESLLSRFPAESYPWCTVLRVVSDNGSALQRLLVTNRGVSQIDLLDIDVESLTEVTSGQLIDRFLKMDDYRIVAEEGDEADSIVTEAAFDDEDDIVSEEIAEIYVAQGLKMQAIEIYRKLSLLNPKKSAYFAARIEKLR